MNNNQGHKFHGILMLLCCLAPIVLITIVSSINLQSPVLKNVLSALLLSYPLGHLLMMKFMHKYKNAVGEKG